MKTQKNLFSLLLIILLSSGSCIAGLVWTNGALSNPDDLARSPQTIAYSTNGTVFVSGYEKNTTGNTLIVTRKYNSSGTLLTTVINTYAIAAGTNVADYPVSISLDANGNVYVFGRQYFNSTRGYDMVLIKYNSSLSLQWKKYLFNSSSSNLSFNDKPSKMILDQNNDVYISGTWSQPGLAGTEEIVVAKINAAGVGQYVTPVSQVLGKTIYDSGDMCIDNNLNVTIAAKAEDNSSNDYLMYSRITNTGIVDWKLFSAVPAGYDLLGKPEIECTPGGTFYIACSLSRLSGAANHYGKIMIKKFQQNNLLLSTQYTPELNLYINGAIMKMDANDNIYAGADFIAPTGGPYNSHRIYKYNSSLAAAWTYTSPETAYSLSFETFGSSAVFALFVQSSPITTKLRKLNASTGNTIWTESITTAIPNSYIGAEISPKAIAINSSTSEVAFCGQLFGDDGVPTNNFEYRWQVRKYAATSPRFADQNITERSEINLFPVPANDYLMISFKNENLSANALIIIHDMNGREILRKENIDAKSGEIILQINELQAGIYFLTFVEEEKRSVKKFIVSR